jgi:hypothetical protein
MHTFKINRRMFVRITKYYGALRHKYKLQIIIINPLTLKFTLNVTNPDNIIAERRNLAKNTMDGVSYNYILHDIDNFFENNFKPYLNYLYKYQKLINNIHNKTYHKNCRNDIFRLYVNWYNNNFEFPKLKSFQYCERPHFSIYCIASYLHKYSNLYKILSNLD